MNNKKLGFSLIVLTIILAVVFFSLKTQIESSLKSTIVLGPEGECIHEGLVCPYEEINKLVFPTIIITAILIIIAAIGVILIFLEKNQLVVKKTQDQIVKTIRGAKKKQIRDEKFKTLLETLDDEEKKVLEAVKEQDGITQATLRIRTDLSKTKLSFILKELEKRNIIKKVAKGRTNKIFLKKPF